MTVQSSTESDLLVQFSRRGLWIALALLLALGSYALIINLYPGTDLAGMADTLFKMYPLVIVIALAAMRGSLKGASADPRNRAMQAVLNDELRQLSLQKAYRNGFAAVMLAQPVLALLLTLTSVPLPVVLMASATALIGAGTVLCSMLVYDR